LCGAWFKDPLGFLTDAQDVDADRTPSSRMTKSQPVRKQKSGDAAGQHRRYANLGLAL
jgi:hypothetical protein